MPRKQAKITVVGSTNTDMVVKTQRLPQPGATVLGGKFAMYAGGKGANQAVAAARAGAQTAFIGCTGNDMFGKTTRKNLSSDGIDISGLTTIKGQASGVALICVDRDGENMITVAPGANACLSAQHIRKATALIAEADLLLVQLEISAEAVVEAVTIAKENNTKVLLNPAPAPEKPDWLLAMLKDVDYLTPNTTELGVLAHGSPDSIGDYSAAALDLLSNGGEAVVLTMGGYGALVISPDAAEHIPAFEVDTVDTVGAGDCFSACLAVGLAEGNTLHQAVTFAMGAAALSTTKVGAQSSMPIRTEIEAFLKEHLG